MTIISLIYAILGISVIIFIHELGHFLAAKWVGVRVDRFSVGFDPTVFGFRLRFFGFKRGETEYVFGMVPFGGYVKMAGETLLDTDAQEDSPKSDWLVSKSPSARAVVFAAGAAFNIISAFAFFALAFSVGVNFFATDVGWVKPGAPAWQKGLRPGDKIIAIDDKPVSEFTEVIMAVAFADRGQSLAFTYLPAGSDTPKTVNITPKMGEAEGFQSIGVGNEVDPTIRRVSEDGAAARAGVEEGDQVVAANLGGLELTVDETMPFHVIHQEIAKFVNMHAPGHGMKLKVRTRNGTEKWVDLSFEQLEETRPLLGVLSTPHQAIATIRPGSLLEDDFEPGDRVLSVNGKTLVSLSIGGIQEALGFTPLPEDLNLQVERGSDTLAISVKSVALVKGLASGDLDVDNLTIELGTVDERLSGAGLQPGDVLYSVGEKIVETPDELEEHLAAMSSSESFDVVIIRDGRRTPPFSVERTALDSLEGEGHARLIVPPRVRVVSGSAAAANFGIKSGARILKIDGKPLGTWNDLTVQVRSAGSKPVEITWKTPEGEEKSATGEIASATYQTLGLSYRHRQILKKVGILESTVVGLERVKIVAQQVILTLRGLIRRQVEPKNLAGPVGIVYAIYRFSEYGIGTLIYWLALISVNLGILNLLPFPILDGGHLLFLLIEKIKGSPVDIRIQELATTVAFFLIIFVAVFVTYNDLKRLFL